MTNASAKVKTRFILFAGYLMSDLFPYKSTCVRITETVREETCSAWFDCFSSLFKYVLTIGTKPKVYSIYIGNQITLFFFFF